jgi:hypothetical protein
MSDWLLTRDVNSISFLYWRVLKVFYD